MCALVGARSGRAGARVGWGGGINWGIALWSGRRVRDGACVCWSSAMIPFSRTLCTAPLAAIAYPRTSLCTAGRAGQSGVAITLLGRKDGAYRDQLLAALQQQGGRAAAAAAVAATERDAGGGSDGEEEEGADGSKAEGAKVRADGRSVRGHSAVAEVSVD